jgi:hypothetical protein
LAFPVLLCNIAIAQHSAIREFRRRTGTGCDHPALLRVFQPVEPLSTSDLILLI